MNKQLNSASKDLTSSSVERCISEDLWKIREDIWLTEAPGDLFLLLSSILGSPGKGHSLCVGNEDEWWSHSLLSPPSSPLKAC